MGIPRKPLGALVWERWGGEDYEVHPTGIMRDVDHLGRARVVVHVRITGNAGVRLYWRPDVMAWAEDSLETLRDLPGDFTDLLEDVLERLRGPEDRFL